MKIKFFVGIILAFALLSVIYYTLLPTFSNKNSETTEELRKKQDDFFRSAQSPVPKGETFTGLKYFPVDEKYAVKARIILLKESETFTLATSTGKVREFRRFAHADFTIDNNDCRLTILQPVDDANYFFLPFTDATSGAETYGAGRYLELHGGDWANTVIDFNRAYNPYCAYNSGYDCPIPPAENRLNISIKAGEKNYK
jgi:uncharacterized protein (DUF1684 family)